METSWVVSVRFPWVVTYNTLFPEVMVAALVHKFKFEPSEEETGWAVRIYFCFPVLCALTNMDISGLWNPVPLPKEGGEQP